MPAPPRELMGLDSAGQCNISSNLRVEVCECEAYTRLAIFETLAKVSTLKSAPVFPIRRASHFYLHLFTRVFGYGRKGTCTGLASNYQ